MAKKGLLVGLGLLGLVIGSGVGAVSWLNSNLGPSPLTAEKYIHIEGQQGRKAVIARLKREGVIKSYEAFEIYAQWKKSPSVYRGGIYLFKPRMTPDEILEGLRTPLKQMVRIPEGWWINRAGKILEKNQVCTVEEYEKLAAQPDLFRTEFSWLPEGIPSLEGYLFPDTYDFPPTLGAEKVIKNQLENFERRVKPQDMEPEKLRRAVIIGSMVELEAKLDSERPMVAAVIENRLRKPMRLQIDATALYAEQEWRVLGPGEIQKIQSPFNTYLNDGLPPGPIGSPGLASIQAALNPDTHNYYFYVAKGDGSGEHLFSTTYADHLRNIRVARAMKPKGE